MCKTVLCLQNQTKSHKPWNAILKLLLYKPYSHHCTKPFFVLNKLVTVKNVTSASCGEKLVQIGASFEMSSLKAELFVVCTNPLKILKMTKCNEVLVGSEKK